MMASTISKAASGRGSLSIRLRRDSYPLLFIMTSVGGFCASYSFLARGGKALPRGCRKISKRNP